MRDAVADVLLERRALVPRRSVSLIASALLHLLVAVAVVIGARRESLQPRGSIVNIRLAPPAASQPVAPPVPAQVTKPAPPPPTVTEQPKPKKVEEKKPSRKPVEKALFGRSTEKPVEQPTPPTPPAITAAAGTTGVSRLEGGDFPYTIYIDRMLTLIGSHWFRPQTQRDITTQIHFIIERDGTVRDVEVEKASGSGVFDRAALRAVMEASPLPPLPFAYSGTYLGVHLTFH